MAGFVPVADEDNQGKAVPELVRTGGGLGGIGSGHLVQEPVRGRTKALLVLLAIKSSPSVTILISNTRTAGIKGDWHFHAINVFPCASAFAIHRRKNSTHIPRGILAALST